MRAAEALKMARAAGIKLGIDGDDLVLEASAPPRAAVLDLLSRHKAGIVMLRSGGDGWSAEAWQGFFDKRIGISEFDGGLPRTQAEACAFAFCAVEWLNRNLEYSPAGSCLGRGARIPMILPPFGMGSFGQVWPRSRCQPAWYVTRKAEAVATLATMGITLSANFPDDFGKNGGA
jgi:hypothetical protein